MKADFYWGHWGAVTSYAFALFIFITLLGATKPARSAKIPSTSRGGPTKSKGMEGRVVGGTLSRMNQFPYLISMREVGSSGIVCAGSLINESLVLTAGHCFFRRGTKNIKSLPYMRWTAGEHSLETSHEGSEQYGGRVKRVAIHKDYDWASLFNDIALVELVKPFTLNEAVQIVQPATTKSKYHQSNCTVVGWGYTKQQTEEEHLQYNVQKVLGLPDTPRFAKLDIIRREECKMLYKDREEYHDLASFPSVICAGILGSGKGFCEGDSGGPLVCDGKSDGKPLLVGIVSAQDGCGQAKTPGLYTNVAFMEPWLKKAVEALKSSTNVTAQVLRV